MVDLLIDIICTFVPSRAFGSKFSNRNDEFYNGNQISHSQFWTASRTRRQLGSSTSTLIHNADQSSTSSLKILTRRFQLQRQCAASSLISDAVFARHSDEKRSSPHHKRTSSVGALKHKQQPRISQSVKTDGASNRTFSGARLDDEGHPRRWLYAGGLSRECCSCV